MAESLRIMCPNLTCRKVLAIPAAARGKTVRCRACATNIKIPSAGSGVGGGAVVGGGDAGASQNPSANPAKPAAAKMA